MAQIYYEMSPAPQTDGTNIVINSSGEIDLGASVTTKLSKLDSNGQIDYSDVKNTPTIPSKTSDLTNDSDFVTSASLDSWHKYNGAIEEITVNNINTDEPAEFRNVDTSKAYELWFDTSDGKQATVKSSDLLLQSDGTYNLKYVVNTPTAQTKFRLLVKGIN